MKLSNQQPAAAIDKAEIYNDTFSNKEKIPVAGNKKLIKKDDPERAKQSPAPYYDELHFANYE